MFDVRLCRQTVCFASEAWLGLASEKAPTHISRTSPGGQEDEGPFTPPFQATLSLGLENPTGLAQGGNRRTLSFEVPSGWF